MKMFTVWSMLYQMTYYNGYFGHYQLNFTCKVDRPKLLNHKFVYFSQVKVMLSEVSIWKPVLGNDGPSCVRIPESNTNLVDRMQSD